MHVGIHPDLKPWHPHWTTLKLDWSMSGKWVLAPISQDSQGDDPNIYRIARIEKYIDRRGQIREAIAYGQLEKEIMVWYDLERVKQTFSRWIVPTISKWENTRNWIQEP